MQLQQEFERHKCCVIIPTYNNGKTLELLIREVLSCTQNVIVVNDGATDSTPRILDQFQDQIEVITHQINQGKGIALRNAFKFALAHGYDFAITIDSDGQHFPSDITAFLDEIENNPGALVIGARDMAQENVPGKSSFGNKFSNFWFRFETGINHADTQSGYRLYPIRKMEALHYITNRFEFEVEVIVKAAWSGIEVKNVPVRVHYEPGENRISHFRPVQDFMRISILNTYLVIQAIFYYIPFRLVKSLTKENIKQFVKKHFFDKSVPVHIKALSIGFGVFMGLFPIWGYQLLVGISLSHYFKLNKPLFILAANISIPPLIPFILYASYKVGFYLIPNPSKDLFFREGLTFDAIKENLVQYVAGAVVLSTAMGVVFGITSYLYFGLRRKSYKN